jgi:hypothetical protein
MSLYSTQNKIKNNFTKAKHNNKPIAKCGIKQYIYVWWYYYLFDVEYSLKPSAAKESSGWFGIQSQLSTTSLCTSVGHTHSTAHMCVVGGTVDTVAVSIGKVESCFVCQCMGPVPEKLYLAWTSHNLLVTFPSFPSTLLLYYLLAITHGPVIAHNYIVNLLPTMPHSSSASDKTDSGCWISRIDYVSLLFSKCFGFLHATMR